MTDKTDKTTDMTTPETDAVEIKNPAALLAKNKELLAKLAESNTALKATQDALGVAQASATDWQARWHKTAVLDVLDAELKAVSGVPFKYMADTLKEMGLLKMETDKEGIQRPVFFDEKGEAADLSNGLHRFLCGTYERLGPGNELGQVLRGSGARGSGAMSSSGGYMTPEKPTHVSTPATPMPLGLR